MPLNKETKLTHTHTHTHTLYMDNKLFDKNEKELEALIQTVRIYNQDIGMVFAIEKYAMRIMKSGT